MMGGDVTVTSDQAEEAGVPVRLPVCVDMH